MMNYADDMLKSFTVDVPLNLADKFEKFYTVKRPAEQHWIKQPAPKSDDAHKPSLKIVS